MVGRTKHQTKADAERLEILAPYCLPCMIDDWPHAHGTIQHVTSGGRRHVDQHQHTYPACSYHHLGYLPDILTVAEAEDMYGPSFAHNKRAYAERYGTEEQLVLIADSVYRLVKLNRCHGVLTRDSEVRSLVCGLHSEIVCGEIPEKPYPS